MSEHEQLPLPSLEPILWPQGAVSLRLTLLECLRRRKAATRPTDEVRR
jgi:hypothetical protein